MNKCEYCREEKKLTREHIVPAYIYEFQKELENKVIGWNEVAGKMVRGEAKIKDVCAECNNGVLGDLDAYSKSAFVKSGLLVQNYVKKQVSLIYDYDLLLRWLLKVSFNSSRTDGAHKHLFEKYISYIIEGADAPQKNQVSLVTQMASPENVERSHLEKEKFYKLSDGSNILNPFLIRICYGGIKGASGYTLRMIIIGAAVFYLLMFDPEITSGHAAIEIRRILKIEPNSKLLTRKSKYAVVKAGKKSWLDLYENQVARSMLSG